jgi:sulfite reductase (ferredoxin)
MKFLFINHGWTAERFVAEVERRIGYALEPWASGSTADDAPTGSYRDHVGLHRQKQAGLYYAGFSITSGRITTTQLRNAADLATTFGDGTIRLTPMQNLLLLNVPADRVSALVTASRDAELPLSGSPFQRGMVSCTGSEFCKLAITETKKYSIGLAHELEARVPGFTSDIKLHVTGCPNSCGQHWIADVGLQGVRINRADSQVDGYDVFVGGALGDTGRIARRLGVRVPADESTAALEGLFKAFARGRSANESFAAWVSRTPDAMLRASLQVERADDQ